MHFVQLTHQRRITAVELLQLKYFQTVARLEHMTHAAEELRLSQPSLSRTISNLEKELSVKLFDRTGKHIKLNESGKAFLNKINIALSTLEDAKREVGILTEGNIEVVDIAALCGMPLLPDLLASFRKENPRINFDLSQFTLHFQLPSTFDLYIAATPIKILGNIKSIPILTERICLGVPESHPLAKRSSIKLNEFANEGFISPRLGTSLRDLSDKICKEAEFMPNIIFESNDHATVRKLIMTGQGIGFIPEITWRDVVSNGNVVLLHIDEPLCKRTLEATWIMDRHSSPAAIKFREYMIGYFSELKRNFMSTS
jgi:LysR family transcriptional activator of glutamate synthase operon